MPKTSISRLLFILSITTFLSLTHGYGIYHECKHDSHKSIPQIAEVEERLPWPKDRLLASVSISTSTSSSSGSNSSTSTSTSTSSSTGSANTTTSGNVNNNTTTTNTNGTATNNATTTDNTTNNTATTNTTTTNTTNTAVNNTTTSTNTTSSANTTSAANTTTTTSNTTTNSSNPNIRIYPHYDTISLGTDEWKTYIKQQLLPPVISLLQVALRLKYPLTSPIKLAQSTVCGYTTPSVLSSTGNGTEADFVIILDSYNETGTSWVASATSCLVTSGVKRPLVALLSLNIPAIAPTTPTGDPLAHEFNMYVLMHEILHGLGFSQAFFNSYIDSQGNLLTGHVKKVLLAGTNRTVLDLAPLTQKLRNFYGCDTVPGAFMEDDGGSGTAGSHWERRFFPFDLLSSGAIHGRRLTEFTLAFMEGTGWYDPDYTYAEPFYFGQGQGCSFFGDTACTDLATDVAEYKEYCTGTGRGCTEIGRGGGFCKSDVCSDGCRFVTPQKEYDCENPAGVYYTTYSSKQTYGRGLGSKCFSGNLTTSSTASKTTYCFKYNCVGSGVDTTLQVSFGTATLTCTEKGPLTVSGYKGAIDCPDPLEFCSTIGKKYCPRGCMGRGQCVDNVCVCNAGFTGVDCGFTSS